MNETNLSDDLLDGADAIARFTGWSRRRVFHLLETGQLPGFKMGAKWAARKSKIVDHLAKLERGGAAA